MPILEEDNFEWITTSDGRRVQVLRDGHTARASFFDAVSARGEFMTDAERHVMEDAEWRARTAGNRPGYRIVDNEEVRAAQKNLADAYRSYEQDLVAAYKNPLTGVRSQEFVGAHENDLCSVNGYPGRLRYDEHGELRCVADHPSGRQDTRTLDQRMQDHQLRMSEEYSVYAERISNAWRGQ